MRFAYFSELLRSASAMIGNSSAGVREAPFLGIPSLDIGKRQNDRASLSSIVHCSASNSEAIRDFLVESLQTILSLVLVVLRSDSSRF
jgi:UDP-N-acetylglucosamine 2-epimerase (hydrolysing)